MLGRLVFNLLPSFFHILLKKIKKKKSPRFSELYLLYRNLVQQDATQSIPHSAKLHSRIWPSAKPWLVFLMGIIMGTSSIAFNHDSLLSKQRWKHSSDYLYRVAAPTWVSK